MRKYDTTFIIDGTLPGDQREAIIAQYENSLKRRGAEIEQTVRWGLRQLAYEIGKRTHGYYVIMYYNADPSILSAFHREFDLNENILRYMTMLWDGKHPHYVRDEGAPDSSETRSSAGAVKVEKEVEEDIAVDDVVEDEDLSDEDESGDDEENESEENEGAK